MSELGLPLAWQVFGHGLQNLCPQLKVLCVAVKSFSLCHLLFFIRLSEHMQNIKIYMDHFTPPPPTICSCPACFVRVGPMPPSLSFGPPSRARGAIRTLSDVSLGSFPSWCLPSRHHGEPFQHALRRAREPLRSRGLPSSQGVELSPVGRCNCRERSCR